MLKGCIVALITPFDENKEVDYPAFQNLLDFQLQQGVRNFIINGTTAEAVTMSLEEKRAVAKFVIDYVPEDVVLGCGVSSNDTAKLVAEINNVEDLAFDYVMISTPYYNKTSQRGLIKHIETALEVTAKKVILYNIPSRTGMQFDLETLDFLTRYPQIVAIKEASGDLNYAMQIFKQFKNRYDVYCGNDDLAYLYACLGAKGVISAVGNIYGQELQAIFDKVAENDYEQAQVIHEQILDLSNMLFLETNPILIKALLARIGLIKYELRLPLVPTTKDIEQKVYDYYQEVIE